MSAADPRELLSRYFLGALSEEELRLLDSALRSDPELAREFAESARDEVLLHQLHVPAARQAEGERRPTLHRVAAPAAKSFWNAAWMMAAAALFVLAILLAISTGGGERGGKNPAPNRDQAFQKKSVETPAPAPRLEPAPLRPEEKPAPPKPELPERKEIEKPEPEPKKPAPEAAPKAPEKPEAPRPPAEGVKRTETAVAVVDRVEGQASVRAGQSLVAGQGLETSGGKSSVVLLFPDRTRVDVGGDSELRELRAEGGKRLFLARGTLSAEISKQPAGQPMVFATPHAEAKVLGTTLKLAVDGAKTRLDVLEGKVQLKALNGDPVEVGSGYFATAGAGADSGARPISGLALLRQMPANSWLSVPNTKLRPVVPDLEKYPKIQGNGGPKCIVGNWSGGAYDPKRNQLYVWGGGSNYRGNEIYAFGVNAMSWTRLTDPVAVPAESGAANPDGTPRIRDTYNGLAFITHADRFFALGGYLPNGKVDVVWTFDPAAKKWAARDSTHPTQYGSACAYDPLTRRLWWGKGNFSDSNAVGLYSYDYDSDRWTKHTTDNGCMQHTAALDTRRGLLVFAGKGEVVAYPVRGGPVRRQVWKTSGADELIAREAPGLDYDPVADRIVGWCGGAVYTLHPDTKVWTAMSASGAPAAGQTGVYGRWRYLPDAEAFIAVTDIDADVHFYRLAALKRK